MWALLLLPIVLLVLYFAQRLLFRRLWDENLTVQISFDRDYIFCGEEANLVETIVNNKYLPLPVLEVGFDMSRWVVFQDEENSTVSDMTYRRDVFTTSVRQRITRTLPVRGKKRGYYRIASTTVTSYDFLMTEKQVAHFPQETEFYVLPAHISASHIRIPYSKIMGLLVSRRRVYDDPVRVCRHPRLPPQRPHEIHQLEGLRARRHAARQSARFHAVPKGHCPA